MLRFSLKNLLTRKVQTVLIMLSVIVSTSVAVLAYNVSTQVSDGITDTAGYYSVLIGASGSSTQLVMNTMYFTDKPCGTFPYDVISDLKRDTRVRDVIPFAVADSYNGYTVAGSTTGYLEGKALLSGEMFDDGASLEAVVGYEVARACNLSVGDIIHTSHSATEEHSEGLTVRGILKETHTVYDNTVFTQLKTIWDLHSHGEHTHEDGTECSGEENMVTAFCIRTKSPSFAMTLRDEYDGKIISDEDGCSWTLQAVEPMSVVRDILSGTDRTKYIVYALSGIILVMNILVITIITVLNMFCVKPEIELMRLIGLSLGKINLVYLIQNSLTGFVSCTLSMLLSHLSLGLVSGYVRDMGVVLDRAKVYPLEIVIVLAVFIISVVPTLICTAVMSGKSVKR